MNKTIRFAALALAALLSFAACEKSDDNQTSVTVSVKMPGDFPTTAPAYSGDVTITNTTMGKSYTAKAVNGTAEFDKVYQGIYDVLVSGSMTADEFKAAAPELAKGTDILLNGNASNVQVVKDGDNNVEIQLTWAVKSDLLISRMYTNGTKSNAGAKVNYPKYWEIYNNTDNTIYLDGLCIAQAHGNSTSDNPCELYTKYQNEATYASRIARLDGTHGVTTNIPLEAGKSIVIAWNAHNFIVRENSEGATDKCTMNVDLSNADYEIESTAYFWNKYGDNTNVPNLKAVYDCYPAGSGFLQMTQAVFIFFATEEDIDRWAKGTDATSYSSPSQQMWSAKRVPNDIIIDAVETVKTGASQQKRIPDALDAKGVEAMENMGYIFDRKIQYITADGRKVLLDTNNSANDFVAVGSSDPDNYDGSHLVIKNYDAPEIQPGYKK